MSTKRVPIDLMALTAETAQPMAEAVQRSAPPPAKPAEAGVKPAGEGAKPAAPKKAPAAPVSLEPMNFKVPAEFRRRFRQSALSADLKLNELLYAALDAWEKQASRTK